jgi:hypothetical protein
MTVEFFIHARSSYQHESAAVVKLAQAMKVAFTATARTYFLVANVPIWNRQADALILMPDAIALLELKSCGDPVVGDTDHAWQTTDGHVIHGGKSVNPYQQVKATRGALMKYLDRNKARFMDRERAARMDGKWGQISAAIVFSPVKHEDSRIDLPKPDAAWLQVIGLNEVPGFLYTRASSQIDVRRNEMQALVTGCLNCSPWSEIEPLLASVAAAGHLWLLDENDRPAYAFPIVDAAKIGRSRSNELIVPPRFSCVSRRHAHLSVKGEGVYLYDDQSTHGTFVDGQPVPQHGLKLEEGSLIFLGAVDHRDACKLRFEKEPPLVNATDRTTSTML